MKKGCGFERERIEIDTVNVKDNKVQNVKNGGLKVNIEEDRNVAVGLSR